MFSSSAFSGVNSGSSQSVPVVESAAPLSESNNDIPKELSYVTEEDIKKVEDTIKKWIWLKSRALGFTVSLVGSTLETSESVDSVQHLVGAAAAFNRVSKYLDATLRQDESALDHEDSPNLGFLQYLKKVSKYSFHRIEDQKDCPKVLQGPKFMWSLVKVAAEASSDVYEKFKSRPQEFHLAAKGNVKVTRIALVQSQNQHVLVVSIRGSFTKQDWVVNANGEPKLSHKLLDGSAGWHHGFLVVAKAMHKEIAQGIAEVLQTNREIKVDEIVFTGHSAGGAVAQLFYALAQTPESHMSAVTEAFKKIHCITFAAPPISTIPITPGDDTRFASALFLAFVNEGDVVPLAQEAYIKALLDVYVLSEDEMHKKYGQNFSVPRPYLRVSGQVVVLQDVAPGNTKVDQCRAVTVAGMALEQKLFGNPLVHSMEIYLKRIRSLAKSAGLALEDDSGGPVEEEVQEEKL